MPAKAPESTRNELFVVFLIFLRLAPCLFLAVGGDFEGEGGGYEAERGIVADAQGGMQCTGEGVHQVHWEANDKNPGCCVVVRNELRLEWKNTNLGRTRRR